MTTLTAPAQTPDAARRRRRKGFLEKAGLLAAGIRRASQKAEAAILESANARWFRNNPEDEPSTEFQLENYSHLAELETALDTLLSELNAAIEASHAFD